MRKRFAKKPKASLKTDAFTTMVEKMPVAVMTCNLADFTINYVNEATIEGLRSIEHVLPCKADDIVGQCIDIFHKKPEHQRALLSDPKNLPHQAQIEIGGEVLDLLVSAIYEGDRYVGPMLTWKVITESARAEQESQKLLQMVNEMPINVMMLDKETFDISYVNKTSIETLRSLQHLLPVQVDELQGQCVDIFHKNPSHQRALLADPGNLPHNAKIKLGDETLDLRVSAIMDACGDYLGPMLNWTVVTDRVELADNVSSVMGAVSSAAAELEASASSMAAATEETNAQAATVASASEQLQASISEISQQVAASNDVAKNALEQAQQTSEMISGLSESANTIGDVISLIQDIAEQTNLLALNATIEAARAGEAGKGFAVVASEVKELAGQTAKATAEISQQIEGIQTATGTSVEAVMSINETISEIAQISSAIAAAVEEQSAATQQVAENIAGVSDASKETGDLVAGVSSSANTLSSQAQTLQARMTEFLEDDTG